MLDNIQVGQSGNIKTHSFSIHDICIVSIFSLVYPIALFYCAALCFSAVFTAALFLLYVPVYGLVTAYDQEAELCIVLLYSINGFI
jgi:uncharacterized membrane protein YfbV (UPF0208 family)